MEVKKSENGKYMTPSTSAHRLVDKVINSNSNCDNSPFRLLPNFSTPPSRLFHIKNPFDSPLVDRLHLPICSPGLFAKSTPKKDDKFRWSICDISNLKPAEIETASIDQHTNVIDPTVESQIQERISSFFNENSIVPSPSGQIMNQVLPCEVSDSQGKLTEKRNSDASTQTNLSLGPILPKHIEEVLKSYQIINEGSTCSNEDKGIYNSDTKESYLPDQIYYKKLFGFENESPQSSPPLSTGDSPIQLSPLKELDVCLEPSFSECQDKRGLNECVLSPITPEVETPHKDRADYMSVRESRSACRLFFSENMSLDGSDNNVVPDILDPIPRQGTSFDGTLKISPPGTADSSNENWEMEYKHVSLASQDYEDCNMDILMPQTPNTGLFTSQRKRLSDSFKHLDDLVGKTEGVKFLGEDNAISAFSSEVSSDIGFLDRDNGTVARSEFLYEGSSDMGYHSGSGVAPSIVENTWNNSHLIASTPTKKRSK